MVNVLDIIGELEAAKEDYTEDDVFDALEVMQIKDSLLMLNNLWI